MPTKARDYSYDKKYNARPEQLKNRTARNAARAIMEKAGKVSKHDGRDVDHKRGVSAGNGKANLRVLSASKNRSIK